MIACDTNQLHRIERSIADLERRATTDQARLKCMLEALQQERRKLLALDAVAAKWALPPELALAGELT